MGIDIYFNLLWFIPFIVFFLARKKSILLRSTIVGISFGLVISYASDGLYALYFAWPVSQGFGQFCFYLSFIHDLAGIRVAMILKLVSAHSPLTEDQRPLIEVVKAISWAVAYGLFGFVWGWGINIFYTKPRDI